MSMTNNPSYKDCTLDVLSGSIVKSITLSFQKKKDVSNSSIAKSLIMLQTNTPPTVRYIKSRKICSFFARVLRTLKMMFT